MNWFRPESANDERLKDVAATLSSGGLAIIPTDTVYGLSANALTPEAVLKVFQAKHRAAGKPLIVIAADYEMARSLASDWKDEAERLAKLHWPGPLSLIVNAAAHVPTLVTAGTNKLAIRVPNNPLTQRIIELAGDPLVSTSANISGDASPNTAEATVELALSPLIDWLVDTGPCNCTESTVVDTTASPAQVLRQGPIAIY
jgi:L-threonylcarbamoyladenylate synthase